MRLTGQALTRREDPPLLTGRGVYVDELGAGGEAGGGGKAFEELAALHGAYSERSMNW